MSEPIFHGVSFFTGLFTGIALRWTDIVPIMGGVLLGMSIKRIPALVDFASMPKSVKVFVNDKAEYTKKLFK